MDVCADLAYAFALTMAILLFLESFIFAAGRFRRRIVIEHRRETLFVENGEMLR